MIYLNTNEVYTEEAILRQQKKGGSIVERLMKNSERTEKITETIFHKCGESKITLHKYSKNKYKSRYPLRSVS